MFYVLNQGKIFSHDVELNNKGILHFTYISPVLMLSCNHDVPQMMSSSSESTHMWVLLGLFLELFFSKSGGVHDMLHIYPLCGIF